jgi:hypothetical protein
MLPDNLSCISISETTLKDIQLIRESHEKLTAEFSELKGLDEITDTDLSSSMWDDYRNFLPYKEYPQAGPGVSGAEVFPSGRRARYITSSIRRKRQPFEVLLKRNVSQVNVFRKISFLQSFFCRLDQTQYNLLSTLYSCRSIQTGRTIPYDLRFLGLPFCPLRLKTRKSRFQFRLFLLWYAFFFPTINSFIGFVKRNLGRLKGKSY